jgi:hypothetical protein
MKLVLVGVVAALLSQPAFAFREIEMQDRYCAGMPTGVRLADGSIVDCLDGDLAIEVDFSDHWAAAIGQSLHYARVQGERSAELSARGRRGLSSIRPAIILVCNDSYSIEACSAHQERLLKTAEYWRIGLLVWLCDSRSDAGLADCDFVDLYEVGNLTP